MAMLYTDWLSAVTTILNIGDTAGVAAFSAVAPRCIEYTEGRILKDAALDFLYSRTSSIGQTTTTGSRSVPIPASMIVVEGVTIVLPSNTAPAVVGAQRVPLLRTTRQFIDMIWPIESQTQTPASFQTYYAIFDEEVASPSDPAEITPLPSSFLIAPTPDNVYVVEVTGTEQPAPLSAANSPTFLTTYFPELYLAASLVWGFGFQRDFGAQTADPQTAMSWEKTYQDLKAVAMEQSARQKSQGAAWTSFGHPAIANLIRAGTLSPEMMAPPGGPMPMGR